MNLNFHNQLDYQQVPLSDSHTAPVLCERPKSDHYKLQQSKYSLQQLQSEREKNSHCSAVEKSFVGWSGDYEVGKVEKAELAHIGLT